MSLLIRIYFRRFKILDKRWDPWTLESQKLNSPFDSPLSLSSLTWLYALSIILAFRVLFIPYTIRIWILEHFFQKMLWVLDWHKNIFVELLLTLGFLWAARWRWLFLPPFAAEDFSRKMINFWPLEPDFDKDFRRLDDGFLDTLNYFSVCNYFRGKSLILG